MFIRVVLLLVLAAGVGFATFHLVQQYLASQRQVVERVVPAPAPPPQRELTRVLVAQENLPVGRLIRPEDLRWQAWPDENLSESYVIEDRGGDATSFHGAVVRREIVQGEPVTDAQIARPGERGFMAAVLGPGMRAVTIPINPRTGIAGFIFPGDRVDVLLTHTIRDETIPDDVEQFQVTETVFLDMRVLAIDQSLASPQDGAARLGGLATLEVTPRQAEMMTVVLTSGTLSLSLRSLTDPTQPEAIALARDLERPRPSGAQLDYFGAASELTPPIGRSYAYVGDVSQIVTHPEERWGPDGSESLSGGGIIRPSGDVVARN